MKLFFTFLFVALFSMITGCASFMQANQRAAVRLVDAKERYCAETNETIRAEIRVAYRAEAERRGLPPDQINCP